MRRGRCGKAVKRTKPSPIITASNIRLPTTSFNAANVKFPKPKKVKHSTLKRKCDVLFSSIVRSFGRCQAKGAYCKCGGMLQCAHLISRWNLRLRWAMPNSLCLCAGHHRYFTNRPLEWVSFLQEHYPTQYAYVMEHKNELTKETLEEVYKRLKDFGT